jgi:hypothetical protein
MVDLATPLVTWHYPEDPRVLLTTSTASVRENTSVVTFNIVSPKFGGATASSALMEAVPLSLTFSGPLIDPDGGEVVEEEADPARASYIQSLMARHGRINQRTRRVRLNVRADFGNVMPAALLTIPTLGRSRTSSAAMRRVSHVLERLWDELKAWNHAMNFKEGQFHFRWRNLGESVEDRDPDDDYVYISIPPLTGLYTSNPGFWLALGFQLTEDYPTRGRSGASDDDEDTDDTEEGERDAGDASFLSAQDPPRRRPPPRQEYQRTYTTFTVTDYGTEAQPRYLSSAGVGEDEGSVTSSREGEGSMPDLDSEDTEEEGGAGTPQAGPSTRVTPPPSTERPPRLRIIEPEPGQGISVCGWWNGSRKAIFLKSRHRVAADLDFRDALRDAGAQIEATMQRMLQQQGIAITRVISDRIKNHVNNSDMTHPLALQVVNLVEMEDYFASLWEFNNTPEGIAEGLNHLSQLMMAHFALRQVPFKAETRSRVTPSGRTQNSIMIRGDWAPDLGTYFIQSPLGQTGPRAELSEQTRSTLEHWREISGRAAGPRLLISPVGENTRAAFNRIAPIAIPLDADSAAELVLAEDRVFPLRDLEPVRIVARRTLGQSGLSYDQGRGFVNIFGILDKEGKIRDPKIPTRFSPELSVLALEMFDYSGNAVHFAENLRAHLTMAFAAPSSAGSTLAYAPR